MSYKTLSAPMSCQIELTTECSHSCLHCYNHWREQGTPGLYLLEEQARMIIQELASLNVFEIVLTGGEPLMNFDVLKTCLEEAGRQGLKVSLNSNLVPLTREKARILKENGVHGILTSLMGPNAGIHDSIAQKAGSFRRAISNFLIAQEEGIRVTVNMVVSKANILFIKETAQFVASLGIKTFTATKAGCPGNCDDFSGMSLSTEEFQRYLRDLSDVQKEYGLKVDFLEGYPLCGIKHLEQFEHLLGRKCLAGVTTCTISTDGEVRPCSRLDQSYGNMFRERLTDIWKRMTEWRDGSILPVSCRSCEISNLCGGGCRMESKMRSGGDICAMDPYANLENVHESHRVLTEMKRDVPVIGGGFAFTLADGLRWRPESFGAIVVGKSAKSRMFLNHDGLQVFLQIQSGEKYHLDDHRIAWGKVNPSDFLQMLLVKGGIKPLKGE